MTYRLAQYVVLDYVSKRTVYEAGREHESLGNVAADDVHVIAASAGEGEILCYMVIKGPLDAPPRTTLRIRDRQLFPIEQIFGWGVYNRLSILPDLPLSRVRELERFVKNQQRQTLDELSARAPAELMVALLRLLTGPLALEIDACLGDVEGGVKAIKMFDFFHVPNVVIHGVVPYLAPDAYPLPSYQQQTRYPSALLCSDICRERLAAVEQALAQPGKEGMAELFKLKADPRLRRSSLEPEAGRTPLTDATVPQQGIPMETRRKLLDVGEWLRTTEVFRSLSSAEAAVLATFLERRAAAAGDFLIRQGDTGDDLFLIEEGRADVEVVSHSGQRMKVASLGPGDHFGEISLVAGGERTADVIARISMTLLRLSKEAYTRYLAHTAEVEHELTRTALARTRDTTRHMTHVEAPSADVLGVFQDVLPPDAIVSDAAIIARRYGRNVTALERRIPLVLRPGGGDDVAQIVSLANVHHIPLYPFSTGRNWGLGSKLPVVDGCVVVDLSRMDRIVEVNEEFAYAIIEPGVTQGALSGYLQAHHPGVTLNFTGSFAHTSIVGNVLERGDGAYGRVHDLLGVRGILGNGKPFSVGGLWHHVGRRVPSHHSRYTAGPDLSGMFAQSSFGLVTQMAFRLIHKPERCYIVWGAANDEQLERLVDAFDHFGRQGAINRGSVNIGYANRFVQARRSLRQDGGRTGEDEEVWNFYVLVPGTARATDAITEDLKGALTPLCVSVGAARVDAIRDPYAELPQFLHPLVKPLLGSPDTESIKLIYDLTSTPLPDDPREIDADQTPFGMKCYIPVIPPRGPYARRAAEIVSSISAQFDLNVKLSIFGDGRALITIHFRSDDEEQVRRAEQCEAALWDAMVAAGFPPYRASIDQMGRLADLQLDLFDLVADLKSVLDPNGIISPGRYSKIRAG